MQSSMSNEIYHDNRFAIQSLVQVSLSTPTAEKCIPTSGDASQPLSLGPQSNRASALRYTAAGTTTAL